MKYIKTYEQVDNLNLIPNNMYINSELNMTALFLGYDNHYFRFPIACIIFPYKNNNIIVGFDSIHWSSDIEIEPLNITIKDYLMKNPDLVSEFLYALEYLVDFGSNIRRKVEILRRQLLNDNDIQIIINLEKYNL